MSILSGLKPVQLLCWCLTLVAIPMLSVFGRPLQRVVDTQLTAAEQTFGLLVLMAVFLSTLVCVLYRSGKNNRLWPALLFCAAILLMYNALPLAEKIHVVIFGFFGFFSLRLLGMPVAFVICLAVSGLDELLQHFLAERIGDWLDVLLNFTSSTLGIVSAFLLEHSSITRIGK